VPIPHGSVANIGGEHRCVLLIRFSQVCWMCRVSLDSFPFVILWIQEFVGSVWEFVRIFSFGLVIWPRSSSSILPTVLVPVPPGGTSRQWMWMWVVLFGVSWITRLRSSYSVVDRLGPCCLFGGVYVTLSFEDLRPLVDGPVGWCDPRLLLFLFHPSHPYHYQWYLQKPD
jgi:hypothetical protein